MRPFPRARRRTAAPPTAVLLALLAALLVHAPAAAAPTGSIVFLRDHNVWIAPATDPGAARAVTADGTADSPYLVPSQDDVGRIVAIRGGARGDLVRMDQQGALLNPPGVLGGGNVQDLDVRGDGEVLVYASFESHQSPQGFLVVPTVDFAYPDGRDPAPIANPAFDRATATYATDQVFMITYEDSVPYVSTYGPGDAIEQLWYRPCEGSTAVDEGAFCFPLTVDVTTAEDRAVVAVPANEGWPVGSRLIVHRMAGSPPAVPTYDCELIGPEPDSSSQDHFVHAEWSPDGSALVWEVERIRDFASIGSEIFMATGFDRGCAQAFASARSLGPGSAPDWSAAAVGTAPTPGPGPEPTDPPGGGGSPPPAPGAVPQPSSVDPTLPVGAFDGDPRTTERVNASNPIAVALLISRGRFADGAAGRVVLARDDTFPDSLAGATLTVDGPLLFTPTDLLHEQVRDEIARVLPPGGTVHVLGGLGAISLQVEEELRSAGYVVDRLAGPSRVETAIAVADRVRQLLPGQRAVGLARAGGPADNPTAGWADSVTGGAWGAATGVPVLVTDSAALHPAVAAWLQSDGTDRTVLFGGAAALSDAVAAAVPNPVRIAASERTGTAAAIATSLWGASDDGPRRFTVIDGFHVDGWAYGLAAAGLASDAGAPVLMVNGDMVPDATASMVGGCDEVDLALIGGGPVITHEAGVAIHALDQMC